MKEARQHDAVILADGIEHHGAAKARRHFANNPNRFGFKPRKMRWETLLPYHQERGRVITSPTIHRQLAVRYLW